MTVTMTLWDGRSVPRIGMGCWAIGGPFLFQGRPDGWGDIDDAQSIRSIELAMDLGAVVFDTADAYGTGHSESVLGRAIKARRGDVVIATKFGWTYDAARRSLGDSDVSPDYIEGAAAASLKRLGGRIDLYQIHVGELAPDVADAAATKLEELCDRGLVGHWGWSTDDATAAARMTQFPHFVAVQQELNVFRDGPEMLALCAREGLVSLNRSPLAMGLLTGKFGAQTALPGSDVRGAGHSWVRHFKDGRPVAADLVRLEAIRELLQSGGRTLAQGALGWILARSPRTLPIPGFKSEAQVRDNLGAAEKGPLPAAVMAEIDAVLAAQEAAAT